MRSGQYLFAALVTTTLSLSIREVAHGGERTKGRGDRNAEQKPKEDERATKEDTSRWCAPELEAVRDTVCVTGRVPADGPATLVVFLHGVIPQKTTWQWTQQRAVAKAPTLLPFVAVTPRGLLGVGPEGMKDLFAWPTGRAAQKEVEHDLLASFDDVRRELEAKQGRRFDEVFLVGFSSGAYYASSVALRGAGHFDGFGILTGGATTQMPEKETTRAPIFLSIASRDATTRDDARSFSRTLATWHWPHRVREEPIGHMFTPEEIATSVRYLRSARK